MIILKKTGRLFLFRETTIDDVVVCYSNRNDGTNSRLQLSPGVEYYDVGDPSMSSFRDFLSCLPIDNKSEQEIKDGAFIALSMSPDMALRWADIPENYINEFYKRPLIP